MKLKEKLFTFRKQIIIAVVALAVVPLFLFGIYTLRIAGESQKETNKLKNILMLNLSRETEEIFKKYNKSLVFTGELERNISDDTERNRILINALQNNDFILGVGYLKKRNLSFYFGEEINNPSLNERITSLLRKHSREKWIQITDSYKYRDENIFDLLYPLDKGDFVFVTFSLKELTEKFKANSIGKTGQFAVVKEKGELFAGEINEEIRQRFNYLEIGKIIKNQDSGILLTQRRGYQLKGKKLEELIWPFWLVFSQESKEAYSLTRGLKYSVITILFILLAVSGTVSFALANNFSRPISNLLEAVKKNFKGKEIKAHLDKRDKGELALLIKEFNKMIDNLKETREKLIEKEKLAAVGEMANIIGHDIRNPLSAIKNGVYYIKHAVKEENPKIKVSLNIIDREIESISKIIEDLLSYSRQRPPKLKPVDINALYDEIISLIDVPDVVEIEKEVQEGIAEYKMDRGEIRQALVNIVNNAVQACEKKGKGKVEIRANKDKETGDLRIVVRDNGIGIPEDKKQKIFQAFYSTKDGGTGLGTSSAKRIVERHQGLINLHSEYNVGTEIVITIPKDIKTEA